jgi:hypothetical protein
VVFPGGAGALTGSCYAKVVSMEEGDPPTLTARFTTRPSRWIEDLRRYLAGLG